MQASAHADLPLHYGTVPPWLATRMTKLGRAIIESIVQEYGKKEVMKRLSDPLWFQSFGCVLGMDWHSSGITTSVMGALKRGLAPISRQLGLYVCGGRGQHSRKTPRELMQVAERTGLNGPQLVRASRLSAKIDNTAIQDGFQIYLHNFLVTDDGEWLVIQQGMNGKSGFARRYHWHSSQLASFLNDPHTSVCGQPQGAILNLTDPVANPTRDSILQLSREHPEKMMKEIRKLYMPAHHDVRLENVDLKRLGSVIALAYESDLSNFESLLLTKGLGPRTLQSLTLVSEVIHGTPSRFKDPARFSFAHGGKDGHPFPVPTRVYDEVIDTLDKTVQRARINLTDKQQALKSLHQMAKKIERHFIPNDRYDELIAKEWKESPQYGGRTVFDVQSQREWVLKKQREKKKKGLQQLSLF